MKTTFTLCAALLLTAGSASAQILRSEALSGAVLGGVAGAVIGHNSGDLRNNPWRGAAIGAGAGLIVGEMVGNAHASRGSAVSRTYGTSHYGTSHPYAHVPLHVASPSMHVGVSYGSPGLRHGHHSFYRRGVRHGDYRDPFWAYGHRRFSGWGHHSYAPVYSYYPGYGHGYPHASYGYYGYGSGAGTGLLLGALTGGIIGHNSGTFGHNAWRGAAWGAGAGWLLGTIADARRRTVVSEVPVVTQPMPAVQSQPVPAQQPSTVIINNYYNTSPMSSANGLFGR